MRRGWERSFLVCSVSIGVYGYPAHHLRHRLRPVGNTSGCLLCGEGEEMVELPGDCRFRDSHFAAVVMLAVCGGGSKYHKKMIISE